MIELFVPLLISSGGKECEGELQYCPFRMTPYLMKVQDTVHAEDQFCCLLLAERVHSGYDGKKPPADFRVNGQKTTCYLSFAYILLFKHSGQVTKIVGHRPY